jgi:hypothetical protein
MTSFIICTHPQITQISLADEIKENELGGSRGAHGRGEKSVRMGKPEGKRPLGRLRRRWEDDIRMDRGEIGKFLWGGFSWFRIGVGGGLLCGDEPTESGATELSYVYTYVHSHRVYV